jgi:hypothetical protein
VCTQTQTHKRTRTETQKQTQTHTQTQTQTDTGSDTDSDRDRHRLRHRHRLLTVILSTQPVHNPTAKHSTQLSTFHCAQTALNIQASLKLHRRHLSSSVAMTAAKRQMRDRAGLSHCKCCNKQQIVQLLLLVHSRQLGQLRERMARLQTG